MTIAIVILSFRRASATGRCIESIRATTTLPYRIFLVDNGSPDLGTRALLDSLDGAADLTLLRLPQNVGPSAGRNVALKSLTADYNVVALFDNDMIALSGWDRAALCAFASGADLIQPKLLEADGCTLERGPNGANVSPFAINPEFIGRGLPANDPLVCTEQESHIVGSGLVQRAVFDRIGFFDDRLQIGEDFDFSFRARKAGLSLRYVPECVLIHDHSFDLDYDQERGRPEKYLIAHVVLWRRWRKALLSPRYLHWYSWLHFNAEPMYLPPSDRWRTAYRRLRRRLMREQLLRRYPNDWTSLEDLNWETEALAEKLALMDDGHSEECSPVSPETVSSS